MDCKLYYFVAFVPLAERIKYVSWQNYKVLVVAHGALQTVLVALLNQREVVNLALWQIVLG